MQVVDLTTISLICNALLKSNKADSVSARQKAQVNYSSGLFSLYFCTFLLCNLQSVNRGLCLATLLQCFCDECDRDEADQYHAQLVMWREEVLQRVWICEKPFGSDCPFRTAFHRSFQVWCCDGLGSATASAPDCASARLALFWDGALHRQWHLCVFKRVPSCICC